MSSFENDKYTEQFYIIWIMLNTVFLNQKQALVKTQRVTNKHDLFIVSVMEIGKKFKYFNNNHQNE